MPKFKTKDGFNTLYAFACGYIESAFNDDYSKRVTLSYSHGVFELKSIDETKREDAGTWPMINGWNDPANYRVWQCPKNAGEAKKAFLSECKRLSLTPQFKLKGNKQ